MLVERGVKPESLPSSEDVTKVRRRLNSEDKKILTEIKKNKSKKTKKR
jgi:DNA-damage-inducible protein D